MIASTKNARSHSILARVLLSLTLGLMLLSVFAASAFAAPRGSVMSLAAAGPVIATGGGVTFDEDCDDEDDDDDCEDSGGGLPATDTAPELSTSTGSTNPVPVVAALLLTGLVGGAMKVATKRSN